MNENQIVVGFVRSPHGNAGEFKVESASGFYEHLAVLKEVSLRCDKAENAEKVFSVESAKIGNNTLYMKLANIDSDDEAKKFSGWEIVVPKSAAHKLKKDEWYFDDLKGCALVYSDGCKKNGSAEIVGQVTNVLEGGNGFLLEIAISESCDILADSVKFDADGKVRTVFVPFSYRFLSDIDVKSKTIQLMHLWILE